MIMPRALLIAVLLVATAAFTRARTLPAVVPAAIDAVPSTLGPWRGVASTSIDADTERQLAADAYVTRTYTAAGALPVDLYIAYYAQQRPNVSIHSPLHCLPGTGWEPLDVSTIDLGTTAAPQPVRRMIVRKNLDRAIVLYWYAMHGRSAADELTSKMYLLRDSLIAGHSDAALVRVAVPAAGNTDAAERDATAFARALKPHLTF
jgi:EpsI family protein